MRKRGEKTDRLSLYIKTRTKKDGTIRDKESANIIVSIYFSYICMSLNFMIKQTCYYCAL